MKERPILFSGPMVRAILEGRKTQTRRVVKIDAPFVEFDGCDPYWPVFEDKYGDPVRAACPYGEVGDRLWVRETFFDTTPYSDAMLFYNRKNPVAYRADDEEIGCHAWKPSIHMPRWASRILLEVVDVRVERLRNIAVRDAVAEGLDSKTSIGPFRTLGWKDYTAGSVSYLLDARESFQSLWDSINAGRGYSWAANPWVWVVEFKRIEA